MHTWHFLGPYEHSHGLAHQTSSLRHPFTTNQQLPIGVFVPTIQAGHRISYLDRVSTTSGGRVTSKDFDFVMCARSD
jgi:hypothetical protein